ncbi:MAG: VCBS repeat-containing protein, partial [Ardenticatenales bacterium]|nr:VCBS repeat-containing protein [Ardenticatenales bacterium]
MRFDVAIQIQQAPLAKEVPMSRPVARALFLFSSITLALFFVTLMVGGLGQMVVVADGTGRSPFHLANPTDAFNLAAGPSPTLCLTTTNYLVASPQDLNLHYGSIAARPKIRLADVNGDNAIDLIQAGNFGYITEIWLNDGAGHFNFRQQQLLSGYAGSIAVGDIDGNGSPDLVASGDYLFDGSDAIRPQTFLNNGDGFFVSDQLLPTTNILLSDLELDDLDGDKDLDLVAVYSSTTKPGGIFWNDGSGHFSLVSTTLATSLAQNIVVADLNGDESPDMVVGRNHPEAQLWFNDGTGHFTLQSQHLTAQYTTSYLVVGDVNGDQFPDVVFDFDNVWINDGAGNFTQQSGGGTQTEEAPYGNSYVLVDVNGDDSPDLVEGFSSQGLDYSEGYLFTYLNDGLGNFCIAHYSETFPATDIAAADLDDDDDLDVVLGLNVFDGSFGRRPFYDGAYQAIWFNRNPSEPIVIAGFTNTGPVPPGADVYIKTQLLSGTNISASWKLGSTDHSNQLNPIWTAPSEPGLYTLSVTLTNELSTVMSQTTILVDAALAQTITLDYPHLAAPATPVPFEFVRDGIIWAYVEHGDSTFSLSYRDLTTLHHLYPETGTYTVTVWGLTTQGWNISQTSRITITDKILSGLNIVAAPNLQVNQPAIFTATLDYGQPTT